MNFQFDSFADFIQMGGHGPYVWFSFGIVFITMLFFGFQPNWQLKKFVKEQRRLQQLQQQQAKFSAGK